MRRQIVETTFGMMVASWMKCDLFCRVGIYPSEFMVAVYLTRLTQVLSVCTLGTPRCPALSDDLQMDLEKKRYLHHYNFPPYSVGKPSPCEPQVAAKSVTLWRKSASSRFTAERRLPLCYGGVGSPFFQRFHLTGVSLRLHVGVDGCWSSHLQACQRSGNGPD